MVNFLTVKIDDKKCTHCYTCINTCPTGALYLESVIFCHSAYECNYEKECEQACPNGAIEILEM